jgi:hypothetical protein
MVAAGSSDTKNSSGSFNIYDSTNNRGWGLQQDASYKLNFWHYNGGWTSVANISGTGAATFSSSVTASEMFIGSTSGFLTLGSTTSYGRIGSGGGGVTMYLNGATRGGGGYAASGTCLISLDGQFAVTDSSTAVTKFRVETNGNVLIGTTTDDTINKLQVSGSGAFTSNLKVSGKTFTTTTSVSVPNATATTVYTMSSGQGIGILTISPSGGGTSNAAYTAICTIGTVDTNYNLLNATLGTANITITRSGANIQVTHAIGSSTTFNVTYLSLQN